MNQNSLERFLEALATESPIPFHVTDADGPALAQLAASVEAVVAQKIKSKRSTYEKVIREIIAAEPADSDRDLTAAKLNQKLTILQHEIGEWAFRNFGAPGENFSKHDPNFVMGNLAGLLGIVEELGELTSAAYDRNAEQVDDALADITIYLIDYANRSGIRLHFDEAETFTAMVDKVVNRELRDAGCDASVPHDPGKRLQILVGHLCHINLKRHQGIRGFNDPVKFAKENLDTTKALMLLLWSTHNCKIMDVTFKVWNKVKTRNWTANPTNADATSQMNPADPALTGQKKPANPVSTH